MRGVREDDREEKTALTPFFTHFFLSLCRRQKEAVDLIGSTERDGEMDLTE